jgi:hypothetical protein
MRKNDDSNVNERLEGVKNPESGNKNRRYEQRDKEKRRAGVDPHLRRIEAARPTIFHMIPSTLGTADWFPGFANQTAAVELLTRCSAIFIMAEPSGEIGSHSRLVLGSAFCTV